VRSDRAAASRDAHAAGRRAESVVADYLFASGFTVLARNVRVGKLELDIVARQGSLVVVVEVRTRGPGSYERAFQSIDYRKRTRVVRGVERLWRARLAGMRGVERVRIDAAAVVYAGGETRVEYVEGAIGPM
jgi:putative endonuclease